MIFACYDKKFKGYKLYNPNEGKIVINRDVEFDGEGAWDWKIDDDEKYNFIPVLYEEEERYKDHQKPIITTLQSLMNSTSPSSSSSSGSSSSDNPPSPLRKTRSLHDLYEVTIFIDDDVILYCHLATCDPIVFEEAINDKKWRIVMDDKIVSIEKNDT